MNNHIDDLFKKALSGHECEPPAYIWTGIEAHLKQKKRKIGLWWWRGIAAVALLAAFLGIWNLKDTQQKTQVASFTIIENTGLGILVENLPQSPEPVADIPVAPPLTPETDCSTEVVVSRTFSLPLNIQKMEETSFLPPAQYGMSLKNSRIRRNFIPLTSKEALQNNEVYMALLKEEAGDEKMKERIKFEISGHFVPAYSSGSYSSSVKNTRGRSFSDSQMEGLMNTGGGLKLSFHKGRRWSLQTGIFYSRMGEKTSERPVSRSTLALGSGTMEPGYATPLGNIKTHRKAVGYRSTQAIILNSIANTDETLEQIFGTLEVPLQLRYRLNDNKVSFSISGGICGNFIVNNKVYLRTGEQREFIGSTEDIRHFNMSTDWGLGVEYPVSPRIKVMVEPGFKYYLHSLSQNDKIDFRPYLFTLSTGIGINF